MRLADRSDLVTAAVLHDIGYAHPVTGFHPLDGARSLNDRGFSHRVCHLVLHHSGSTWEAEERGLDLAVYAEFAVSDVDLGPAHAVLWWADMTTGPDGADVTVEERLSEICARYGPKDVVTRFITRAAGAAGGRSVAGGVDPGSVLS